MAARAVLRPSWADAPQVTLKLHHFFSSVSCGHDRFLAPWAHKVEAESGGRIRIDIFPSMQLGGAPAQLFDQARDGIADIVWATPSQTPGRFPKIEVFELPFVAARRALVNSRAIEDFAAANLKDEFREIHPICFSCRDPGVLHTGRPVQTVEDLRGLKLHVANRFAGEALGALGAHGVPAPMPQVPMALAGHVVDGCFDPWDVVPGLRLHDLLKSHTEIGEQSLSVGVFVLAMNKPAYDRLPRELKAVIDANSGQVAAGMAGAMWDIEAVTVADMVRERGDHVGVLAPEEAARWRQSTDAVITGWTRQMKERRIDGGKLIAGVRELLSKYADEPAPQPPSPKPPPAQTLVAQPQQGPPAAAAASPNPPAVPAAPLAKPAPPPKLKELDIPL